MPDSSEKSTADPKVTLIKSLSKIEKEVIKHTAQFKSIKEIAEILSLSPNTVNNHQANIRKKLNLTGRRSLLKYSVNQKIDT